MDEPSDDFQHSESYDFCDLEREFGPRSDAEFFPGDVSLVDYEHSSIDGFASGDDFAGDEVVSEHQAAQNVSSGNESSSLTLDDAAWMSMVGGAFGQYASMPSSLQFPWEQGVMSDIFSPTVALPLPKACEAEPVDIKVSRDREVLATSSALEFTHASSAVYPLVVQNIKDMDYFEGKNQRLELACSHWMTILSVDWYASTVGTRLALDFQTDPSGDAASETLRAAFGTKSPATLLKRAASMKQFFKWYALEFGTSFTAVLPIREEHAWSYFQWLRSVRKKSDRGFTTPTSFLETVRFCKFTLGMARTELVLESKRLLGFAAVEKRQKGPTVQAPPLEVEHLQKLHEVLQHGQNPIDRLGAAVMLICIYARARWSDIRYVTKVEVERRRNGCLIIYTQEHKTSSVGARREQYLPLIVPWHGVVSHDWLTAFIELYEECGLDLYKEPLGPLLPAPRVGGGFCARPLTTQEASKWLRLFLDGTASADSYRSHSMKCTLLVWCARAGLDKEVRAFLGHHCSALHGSEVVYSRHLQTRAIRKLQMVLHRIRVGLGIDEDLGGAEEFQRLSAGMTPAGASVPVTPAQAVGKGSYEEPINVDAILQRAEEEILHTADMESIKEEQDLPENLEKAAEEICLFGTEFASSGMVQIDSSSGSDSTSSSDDESDTEIPVARENFYSEVAPDGKVFYKHKKSFIMHICDEDSAMTQCKVRLSRNFEQLPREVRFKYPKCIRCFPKSSGRIRSVEDMIGALDQNAQRRKRLV